MGPTYQIQASGQTHDGDPTQHVVRQLALREPPDYARPQPLGSDVLEPGGPRVMPVSQRIEHGPEHSRSREFQRGSGAALAVGYGLMGFKDRRIEGRRYRGTNWISELDGPQESNRVSGWQSEVPFGRYLTI
jgi:hypothetical protein